MGVARVWMGSSPTIDYVSPIISIAIQTGKVMWDVIIVMILLFMLFSFGVWRSFTSGGLREIIEFSKLAAIIENDIFDGETKTFVLERNGKDKEVKIKTINGAWSTIYSSPKSSGSLFFGSKRENGLHLEFSAWSDGEDDFITLIEMDGDKVIRESEFNLEKKGLAPAIYALVDLIERMSFNSSVWDEVS